MAKSLMDFVAQARDRVNHVAADQVETLRAERPDLLILDVRESDEYAQGHIPGAHLVPRGLIEGAGDPTYKKRDEVLCAAHQRPIIVYCASGGRSAMAADTLQQMGFEEVYNLAGGFDNWEAEDMPVDTD